MVSIEYLAGLFDGEGCVMMREQDTTKRGKPVTVRNCALVLGINELSVLQTIQGEFGGTIATATSANSKYMHYRLSWTSGHGVAMAERLLPHSLIKAPQLALMTQWPHVGRGKVYDIDDLVVIRRLIAELHELRAAGYTLKDEAYG